MTFRMGVSLSSQGVVASNSLTLSPCHTSSITSTCGRANDVAAMATRERCPPLSARAGVFCRRTSSPHSDRWPRMVCVQQKKYRVR